jgi:hypothetical protein
MYQLRICKSLLPDRMPLRMMSPARVKLSSKEMMQSFASSKWLGAESNRRHEDFQSSALPTELPSRVDR